MPAELKRNEIFHKGTLDIADLLVTFPEEAAKAPAHVEAAAVVEASVAVD
jgi:hypothetical protein